MSNAILITGKMRPSHRKSREPFSLLGGQHIGRTTAIWLVAVVVLVAEVTTGAYQSFQEPERSQPRLSDQIEKANPKTFAAVREAKQWRNPFIVVGSSDVEIISTKIPGGRRRVAVADLRNMLIALPLSAWPYGRVVAFQSNGLESTIGHGMDTDVSQQVKRTLMKLNVEVELWPR